MEIAESAVFRRTGHDVEILHVTDCLEVTADDEEIHAGPFVDLAGLFDGVVDGVEGPVALGWELVQVSLIGKGNVRSLPRRCGESGPLCVARCVVVTVGGRGDVRLHAGWLRGPATVKGSSRRYPSV